MSGYIGDAGAKQAVLVAEPQPNSSLIFFIKLSVEFQNPNYPEGSPHNTRTVKELSVPMDEARGLTRMAQDVIRYGLNVIGSPDSATERTIWKLTSYALVMVRDPAKAGWSVLPMQAAVTCVVGEEVEAELCPICLVEMEDNSVTTARLPCEHDFHESCINQWFKYNSSCPVCRINLDF